MQGSDISGLVKSLEDLRIRRRDLIDSFNHQEAAILQRLSIESSRDSTAPPRPKSEEETIPEGQSDVFTRSFRYRPIESNESLRPGDRVKVTNALAHVSGPVDQEDRLATVLKVHRVFIEVQADSGHVFKRKKENLLQQSF
jgi:hypothetical protein